MFSDHKWYWIGVLEKNFNIAENTARFFQNF